MQDGGAKGVLPSKAPPDVIRDAVREKVAKSGSAADQQHSSSVHGAAKQQRPQGFESKQDAAGNSRDLMLDVAADHGDDDAQQTEAGSAAAPSMGKLFLCFESCLTRMRCCLRVAGSLLMQGCTMHDFNRICS